MDIVRKQPKSGKGTQRLQFDISARGQVPYVTREMTSHLDVVTVGLPVVWLSPPPSRRGARSRRVCDERWCNSCCGFDHVIITHFRRRKSACARCVPYMTLCPLLPYSAASETMMVTFLLSGLCRPRFARAFKNSNGLHRTNPHPQKLIVGQLVTKFHSFYRIECPVLCSHKPGTASCPGPGASS